MADEVRYLNPIALRRKLSACRFRKKGIKYIDYKDADFLLMASNLGQDFAPCLTGTSLKYQRKASQAIKKARHLALMPYVTTCCCHEHHSQARRDARCCTDG